MVHSHKDPAFYLTEDLFKEFEAAGSGGTRCLRASNIKETSRDALLCVSTHPHLKIKELDERALYASTVPYNRVGIRCEASRVGPPNPQPGVHYEKYISGSEMNPKNGENCTLRWHREFRVTCCSPRYMPREMRGWKLQACDTKMPRYIPRQKYVLTLEGVKAKKNAEAYLQREIRYADDQFYASKIRNRLKFPILLSQKSRELNAIDHMKN